MTFNKLGLFLYYHTVNLPNYLLNGIILGMKKLEENKIESELSKKHILWKALMTM